MANRISLATLIGQINDLHRSIESPKFNSAIIHPDYLILYWNEIPRKQWGSIPYKIPYISNTLIEYKNMKDSIWHKTETNSDTTTALCLYKKNKIHNFSQSHQVDDFFWNEYNALDEDYYYDIRVCYKNHTERENWTTISSLGIPSLPPTHKFCGFLKEKIQNPIQNQCYLIIDNETDDWKEYKNCLAMFHSGSNINGWIIYYPRKGWKIDNFYFNGNEWIDIKLRDTMINLHKKITSKDILYKVLTLGFSSRFFNKKTLDEYYNKYINVS